MTNMEKIKIGLQCIIDGTVRCECCGYAIDKHGHHSCQQNCASEAIAVLKEQEDLGEELTNAVELIRKKNKRIEELLKEQEPIPCGEKIKAGDVMLDFYECGHCKNAIRKPWKYCPFCGKEVKWG